ncbi:HIT-like domain-containing protein [Thamnocephalis sphaerospora]|uniref:HIT-like domain-containing protein n=1 Tax=Thamnocephalis sphaerospora TaxID=78915 RepID=A0A4P9XX18_9FUNG|nr:HIT-like domain-containing protein [Thamnocephalis sphaerospora]|eukprot:RKP10837.1 HIT-like domain-containing protein [Thamnocephalis sphaerospora]
MGQSFLKRRCIFCNVRQEAGFNIVYQDEHLIAFHDRSPAGQLHLQVIPRAHIGTIKDLTKNHVELVDSMISLGKRVLTELGHDPAQARIGFHRPPFNSVKHLHMHVITTPFRSRFKALMFKPGHRWYTDAVDVLEMLKASRKVG